MKRVRILLGLGLLLIVLLTCIDIVSAEGQHYLKRSYRKKELACRKECSTEKERTPVMADEPDYGEDFGDEWSGVAVIEGARGPDYAPGNRPISPCVARCISEHCYELEYDRPLEMGEVDERYDFFRQCVTMESAEARRKRKESFASDYDDEM